MATWNYIVFVDGSYNELAKISGLGVRVIDCNTGDSKNFWMHKQGNSTSMNIEVDSFFLALEIIKKFNLKKVKIYTDSKTLAQQYKQFDLLKETESMIEWRRRNSNGAHGLARLGLKNSQRKSNNLNLILQ